MEKLTAWYKGLPTWVRALLWIPAAIVFAIGVVYAVWFGPRGKVVHSEPVGGDRSEVQGASEALGRVESLAGTASGQNTELGKGIDSAQDLAAGIRKDNRDIADGVAAAKESADDLGKLLGIEKD